MIYRIKEINARASIQSYTVCKEFACFLVKKWLVLALLFSNRKNPWYHLHHK